MTQPLTDPNALQTVDYYAIATDLFATLAYFPSPSDRTAVEDKLRSFASKIEQQTREKLTSGTCQHCGLTFPPSGSVSSIGRANSTL